MKNIIKKTTAFCLCALMAVSMNLEVYAGVLDDILGNDPIENTDTAEDTEDTENNPVSDTADETEDIENIYTAQDTYNTILFTDISSHWAKDWINKAVNMGFVSGYEDGTFKPDRTITRAEFSTMLNKAIQVETSQEIDFYDVSAKDWFYNEVRKSVAAGFFSGYDDNTFKPNNPIKRQEAAKVVAGAITTGNIDGEGATLLKDYNTIQEWARESVNTVYNKGYILGYPDKTYQPSKALTRGEAVKIIYEIIDNENIEYGFNITNYDETYTSAVVVGNLNVLDSVGRGNVNIKNVVVLGDIVISAKNVKSVVLTDVKARNIIVESDTNPVKIVYNDNVTIGNSSLPAIVTVQK
jgi:hypothetical protein